MSKLYRVYIGKGDILTVGMSKVNARCEVLVKYLLPYNYTVGAMTRKLSTRREVLLNTGDLKLAKE